MFGSELAFVVALGLSAPAPAPMASTLAEDASVTAPLAAAARDARIAQQDSEESWRREYDQAVARKSSGKRKMLIGAAAAVGGTIFAATAAKSCDIEDAFDDLCEDEADLAWLGYLVSAGGSGVLLWGGIEYFDANGDLNRIEQRRPRSSSVSIALSRHMALDVSTGTRKALAFRASW